MSHQVHLHSLELKVQVLNHLKLLLWNDGVRLLTRLSVAASGLVLEAHAGVLLVEGATQLLACALRHVSLVEAEAW